MKSGIGERVVAGVCGAVWGAALARTLALECHSAFFFGPGGTLLGALLGLSGALLLLWQTRLTAADLLPLLLPLADLLDSNFHPWRGPTLLLGSLTLTLLLSRTKARTSPPPPLSPALLLALLLPLAVYLPDLSPYVGRADTFEFQVVAPRLGIAHPSGYPLYILLGKLFSLLPFGSPAWRVNLSSAICASLASGMLFLALEEAAGKRIGGSADQRISGSADQRISGSADQRISGSAKSSALSPQSSVLSPQPSVLSPQSSVLSPIFSSSPAARKPAPPPPASSPSCTMMAATCWCAPRPRRPSNSPPSAATWPGCRRRRWCWTRPPPPRGSPPSPPTRWQQR